jgi:hypothetical protein
MFDIIEQHKLAATTTITHRLYYHHYCICSMYCVHCVMFACSADSQSSKRQAYSFSVANTRVTKVCHQFIEQHEQPTQLGSPEIGANSGGQHVFDRVVLTEAVCYKMPGLQ